MTPDLIDRAWLLTRLQIQWSVDLSRIGSLVNDPNFMRHVDEAARAVLGHPVGTLMLFRHAVTYRDDDRDYDVEAMKSVTNHWAKAVATSTPMVRGVVVEAETGRPISGAIAYTSDALAGTDDSGAFQRPVSPDEHHRGATTDRPDPSTRESAGCHHPLRVRRSRRSHVASWRETQLVASLVRPGH